MRRPQQGITRAPDSSDSEEDTDKKSEQEIRVERKKELEKIAADRKKESEKKIAADKVLANATRILELEAEREALTKTLKRQLSEKNAVQDVRPSEARPPQIPNAQKFRKLEIEVDDSSSQESAQQSPKGSAHGRGDWDDR